MRAGCVVGAAFAIRATSAGAAPPADSLPASDVLAAAPSADHASGVEVAPAEPDHPVARTLLAIPREVVVTALTGPRYIALGVDDYLASRSPNAFGRDTSSNWRFGAVADWETAIGPSLAVRVGYAPAAATAIDVYGGLFGARGQSGGAVAQLGSYTSAALVPTVTVDAGQDLARVFGGIGESGGPFARRSQRATYDERVVAATAAIATRVGPVRIVPRVGVDARHAIAGGGDPIAAVYAGTTIAGVAEVEHAASGELALAYDTRHPSHDWIPAAAPSTGTYARAAVAYVRGTADRSGAFATGRVTLEVRRLFDLFRGDRVLTIAVRGDAVTAAADALPFDRLPALGGPDRLRAFARDELRDRDTAYADVEYAWALGGESRAFVFVESGAVEPGLGHLTAARPHLDYGGGIRLLTATATSLTLQVAASDANDVGFFVQLGAL